MAVDDDIDSLEAELEGLDDDDGRRSKLLRFLPVILAVGALLVFSVVVIVAYSGDDEDLVVMNIRDIGPETPAIKIEPDSAGAPVPVEGQDNTAYNPMNQAADDTRVAAIAPPPEEPVTPPQPNVIKIPPPEAPNAGGTENSGVAAPEAAEGASAEAGGSEGKDGAKPENLIADAGTAKTPETPQSMPKMPPAETAEAPEGPEAPQASGTAPTEMAQAATIVEPPPIAKKAPKPVPESTVNGTTAFRTMAGVYRVQIASTKSEGLAQREWTDQVKKYPDVLSKLSLTVQRAVVKNRGVFYRVQGGPFEDRAEADSVCRALKSRGQDCLVVRP